MHGRGATDLRRSWRWLWLDINVWFAMFDTKRLDELLQEERDAVIERNGDRGRSEPFRCIVSATLDQLCTI